MLNSSEKNLHTAIYRRNRDINTNRPKNMSDFRSAFYSKVTEKTTNRMNNDFIHFVYFNYRLLNK